MKFVPRRISELGHVVTGKTPPTSRHDLFEGEYLFVTPSDLEYDHYYCRKTERTVTEEAKSRLFNQFIPPGAVMFTCIGATIGKCAIAPVECLTNQQINSIIANDDTDSKFLYYLLCHNVELVKSLGGGSATPIVSKSKFEEVELMVPPLCDQQAISSVLAAYDDLIENNRRRLTLLEEAARQLYREWFVRLRFPGYEHTRIVDGVPEGWRKGCIADFYNTASGGTPSRKNSDYFIGEIPWVKTQELANSFIIETQESITEEALANSSAKLFPERTVLLAQYGATVGELGILSLPATTNQACCAVLPKKSGAQYIHAFLFFRENKDKIVSLSAGAAQKNISQQIVRSFEMVMPTKSLLDHFLEQVTAAFELWLNLERSTHKLRAARDLLLPRLMRGDITV